MITEKLIDQIKKDEGYEKYPYRCPTGVLTIGYGINIDSDAGGGGISKEEAELILKNRLLHIYADLSIKIHFWNQLNQERKDALVNMAFNLGTSGLFKFKKMLDYMDSGEWDNASNEALNSKWAKQVGNRAIRIAEIIKTGE